MLDARRTVLQTVSDGAALGMAAVAGGFYLVIGFMLVLDVAGDVTTNERLVLGTGCIIAGAVMAAGLYLSGRSPWLGAGLISVAVVGMVLLMPWMAVIWVPIGLALMALSLLRARRLSAGGPPGAAA